MFCRRFLDLRNVIRGVVEHDSYRHGVMNLRLILDSERDIDCLAVLHDRHEFQEIARHLLRDRLAVFAIGYDDDGAVEFP